MSAVTIIIDIVLIIIAIILILTVLMQQGQRQGLGAIGGGAETFFGKNKAKSYEGKLATLTKVCAVIFIVLAMVATIVSGTKDSVVASDDDYVVETEAPVVEEEPADEEPADEEPADEEPADETVPEEDGEADEPADEEPVEESDDQE